MKIGLHERVVVDHHFTFRRDRLGLALVVQQVRRILKIVADRGLTRSIVPVEHVHFREWADRGVLLGGVARNAAQYQILDHDAVLSC